MSLNHIQIPTCVHHLVNLFRFKVSPPKVFIGLIKDFIMMSRYSRSYMTYNQCKSVVICYLRTLGGILTCPPWFPSVHHNNPVQALQVSLSGSGFQTDMMNRSKASSFFDVLGFILIFWKFRDLFLLKYNTLRPPGFKSSSVSFIFLRYACLDWLEGSQMVRDIWL